MPVIPFGEYRPDVSDYENAFERDAFNVVPRGDGYGPFPSLAALSQSLGAQCRGAFEAINTDGSITTFAATATDLYIMNGVSLGWTKVSLGGGPYTSIPATDQWWFLQFNSLVICGQANTPPQAWTLGVSAAFRNLAGSPPNARYGGVIGQFVVLCGLTSNPNRVQWSGLADVDGANSWNPGYTNFSDYEDLPDGGETRGIAGGESGVVFQDTMVRRLTYLPNDPRVFDIQRISEALGVMGAGSIVRKNSSVFYYSIEGFFRIDPGAQPVPIGLERVNRTFFADLDAGNLQMFMGISDPRSARIIWVYKSVNGVANRFDKAICYDTSLDRFTPLQFSGEYVFPSAQPSVTLEGLDVLTPNNMAVTGCANNGAGLVRVAVANTALLAAPVSVTLPTYGTVNAVYLSIQNVGGTTEANGNWFAQVVDGTHFDLLWNTGTQATSAFVHAYTSGGTVGGQLDLFGAQSLDSFQTAIIPELAAFDANHILNFFRGAALQATIETSEQGTDGQRIKMKKGFRPITDAPVVYGSFSQRENLQATAVYGSETQVNPITGVVNTLMDARYARIKIRIPAGVAWTYATGIEPLDAKPTSKR